jgi:hypothetical protein
MTNDTGTRGNLRLLLWLVLAVSVAGNVATTSSSGITLLVSIGLGMVAVASGAALVVLHYRHR